MCVCARVYVHVCVCARLCVCICAHVRLKNPVKVLKHDDTMFQWIGIVRDNLC